MPARLVKNLDGSPSNGATLEFAIADGVTITDGDFVYFASGRITNASIGTQRLVGLANVGPDGATATGNTAGTVKCLVYVEPTAVYLIDNDNVGTTFAASHVGTNFDLTGATGAQLVDTSTTGTSGSLICIQYNPAIDPVRGDTSWGLFMIAEHVFSTGSGAQ